jgi:hypothetical protein
VPAARQFCAIAFAAAAVAAATPHAHATDNPAEVFELPSVQVVGTAPLLGFGTPLQNVPANVQMSSIACSRERGR